MYSKAQVVVGKGDTDDLDIHPGLFGWQERNTHISLTSHDNEGDESAGPPRLDVLTIDEERSDAVSGDESLHLENTEQDEDKHTGVTSILVPTKSLSIVILIFLFITHILLGRECIVASKSLATAKKEGKLSSRTITSWRVLPGQSINVRQSIHVTSKIFQKILAPDAESMEFEVYGKPHILQGGTRRVHIISPVNGWATEITNKGHRYMEPVYKNEELHENDGTTNSSGNDGIPFCPLFDAGYSNLSLGRYHYAPTSLVVAQQFWNAAQVFHLFLLICIYGVMTSSSPFTTSMASTTQLITKKNEKVIQWSFFIFLSTLSIILLPFSVYFINPGGHAYAGIMTVVSLATIYLSPPNIRFYLADLPPRCCTPRKHPGMLIQSEELDTYVNGTNPSSSNTSTRTNSANDVVVNGTGIFKLEFIACLCNLGSAMYNYATSKDHVFPYWNNIFHGIDKWLGLTGGDIKLNYEVPGRFMFNMGIKSYHQPLFMPLTFGSTTGGYVFLFAWTILPFIYTFYFMSMYVMARRAPGVRIQRFFALWGVVHFLFLTDVVDYKYGRGLRNEPHEYFHKNEVFMWRIAILLPIYQNLCSGHYKHPQRNKYIGPVLHYFMAAWGTLFFVYQFLLNDLELLPEFLMGWKKRTAVSMLGLGWHYNYNNGYLGTCMVMVYVYGFMMFGGTWCHHVYVGPEEIGNKTEKVWKTSAIATLRSLVTKKAVHDMR